MEENNSKIENTTKEIKPINVDFLPDVHKNSKKLPTTAETRKK